MKANALEGIIRTLPIALGSERKQVQIQIEGEDPSRTGTANILPAEYDFNPIDLEVYRLDDLIAEERVPSDITLMKIDTDGYDLEILRGARELLVRQRPVCHVELNLHCMGWHHQTLDDVLRFIAEIGYGMLSQTGYNSQAFRPYVPGTPFFDNALLIPS